MSQLHCVFLLSGNLFLEENRQSAFNTALGMALSKTLAQIQLLRLKLILEKIDKGHSDDREGESAINIYFCLAKVLFFIWCNELINGQEIFIFIYLLIYIFIYLCIYICIYLCIYIFMYLRRDGC